MDIGTLLHWVIARLRKWTGSGFVQLLEEEREDFFKRAHAVWLFEYIVRDDYPRGTTIAHRNAMARRQAIELVFNHYMKMTAHPRLRTLVDSLFAHGQHHGMTFTPYQVALGLIAFMYSVEKHWRLPSVPSTCAALGLPADEVDVRHATCIAILKARLDARERRLRRR